MTKKELQQEIKELKQQLKESKPKIQNAYLSDIYNIFALDGELYLQSEHLRLIINCESLISNLDLINHLVLKENKKTQQMYLNNLKETINKYA